MTTYTYTKSPVNTSQLSREIAASAITIALDYITSLGSDITIVFKASLSAGEITTLGNLVTAHIALPEPTLTMPVISQALPDPAGFRFRGNAAPWATCAPGTTNLDFTLTEELHVDGGTIVVKDANPGDYCVFQVVHPLAGVVEQFVNKWYVIPGTGKMDVNVYRAKVPQGLIVRVVYNNTGATNVQCGVNLRLHKLSV